MRRPRRVTTIQPTRNALAEPAAVAAAEVADLAAVDDCSREAERQGADGEGERTELGIRIPPQGVAERRRDDAEENGRGERERDGVDRGSLRRRSCALARALPERWKNLSLRDMSGSVPALSRTDRASAPERDEARGLM